jgi:hypothetical protein
MTQQPGKPLAVANIRLAARYIFYVAGIYQNHLNSIL